jgi:hypothetical protein
MTKRLKAVGFHSLRGETIVNERHGNELTPNCGGYGAYTLTTESGRELVVWNSLGEVNLSEVIYE